MVHHHHEYRSPVHHDPSVTVQREWTTNYLSHIFRLECDFVPDVHSHLVSQICPASANIPGRTSTSTSKSIPCDVSSWPCDDRQHDNSGLCAGMGSWHGHLCVGSLVDRRRAGSDHMLPLDLCNVRYPLLDNHAAQIAHWC
jgi:hypothetical protein